MRVLAAGEDAARLCTALSVECPEHGEVLLVNAPLETLGQRVKRLREALGIGILVASQRSRMIVPARWDVIENGRAKLSTEHRSNTDATAMRIATTVSLGELYCIAEALQCSLIDIIYGLRWHA